MLTLGPAGGRGADPRLHGDRRRPRHPPAGRRRGVGRAGDRRGDRRRDPRRRRRLRPDPVRQRVGRRRQLPGRHPRRVRARAAGRDRAEGDRGRRAAACAASRRRRAGATSTSCRCRPCDGAGGAQPAALPVGAGAAAREVEAARRSSTPARPDSQLEKLRLVVPPGSGKQAEVLGEGAAAAPRVVEVLQELGVA